MHKIPAIKISKKDILTPDCYQIQRLDYSDDNLRCKKSWYMGYEKIANSFLNKLIRFETLLTAIIFLLGKSRTSLHGRR
jgi:hypothetical protein